MSDEAEKVVGDRPTGPEPEGATMEALVYWLKRLAIAQEFIADMTDHALALSEAAMEHTLGLKVVPSPVGSVAPVLELVRPAPPTETTTDGKS